MHVITKSANPLTIGLGWRPEFVDLVEWDAQPSRQAIGGCERLEGESCRLTLEGSDQKARLIFRTGLQDANPPRGGTVPDQSWLPM